MPKRKPAGIKIYDFESGKAFQVNRFIEKLGVAALAKKYKVKESTVRKWQKGAHRPSKRTLARGGKPLF